MSKIKVEFAVQKIGEKLDESVREALKGMGKIEIDENLGRVVVETSEPWAILQDKIENTGRRAVLSGFGGQSAVAMINTTGSELERTPVQGVIRFTAIANNKGGVIVDGVVDGLAEGLHGLHVHETGDVSLGCASVGEHYNPRGSPHGGPENDVTQRHAGDLGNIRADQFGRATFRIIDPVLEVWDIVGRSIVITAEADDLGRGQCEKSLIDGNAGARIACGIIARSAGILQNFKKICACDGVTIWDERNKPLAGGSRSQKL